MEKRNLLTAVYLLVFFTVGLIGITIYWFSLIPYVFNPQLQPVVSKENKFALMKPQIIENIWKAPDLPMEDSILQYGKDLIEHTAKYLGPKGTVAQISNGLNCQNCHLEAGTKPFGNNYGLVASTYPKYRARSGTIENVEKRVNDCFERSLNGKPLDLNTKEMIAIKSYIQFVGKEVEKETNKKGLSMKDNELTYLDRPASPEKGMKIYAEKCQSCHQVNGEGVLNENKTEYIYPPLWGKNSYNDAAGLYRISNFAKFIKYNMPLGANYEHKILSDEDAWDVAAFVNSQPRPHKDTPNDWKKIHEKPIDHPFGPYADPFDENQHKYGPFQPILEYQKKSKKS
jgi:thiosulfate dehydrogenase